MKQQRTHGRGLAPALLLLAAACAGAPSARSAPEGAAPAPAPPAAAPHQPKLLLTAAQAAAVRQKIESHAWAREHWEALRSATDTLLARPVELPPRGGTWSHWYVSPKDGQRLVTGRQVGPWRWEHRNPRSGEVFLGDSSSIRTDLDGVAILNLHRAWSAAARDLGIAYQITGDPRYAAKAKEVLLAYADRYLSYPLMNKQGGLEMDGNGRARVTKQSLSESSWLVPLVQGADMVWGTLTAEERARVTDRVLQPAAREVILAHRYNHAHNIQAWKNAAVGLVGLLTEDRELVEEAVNNPREGYFFQLREGMTPDGHWYERAPSYHFFTVEPHMVLAHALTNAGIEARPSLIKPMLDAPLELAKPDLTLARYNDADPVDLRERSHFYEWGYATFGDPRYLAVLRAAAGSGGSARALSSGYALLFGPGELPSAPPAAPVASRNYPRTGYAVLTRGEGEDATWLSVKYDPYVNHGHFDRLNLEVYGPGGPVSEDPGRTGYGAAVHAGWYKTSLSHNTLVVDEGQQKGSEGRTIAFGSEAGADYAVLDGGEPYDGVRFRRSVALLDRDVVLVIDQVRADRERLLDLAFHPHGRLERVPAGRAWTPPDSVGYRYLRDATVRPMSDGVSLLARREDRRAIAITYAASGTGELIAATGPGPEGLTVPVLIVRRRAAATALPWALELTGRPLRLDNVGVVGADGRPVPGSEATAVRVRHPDGREWLVVTNPDARTVRVGSGASALTTTAPFTVRRASH